MLTYFIGREFLGYSALSVLHVKVVSYVPDPARVATTPAVRQVDEMPAGPRTREVHVTAAHQPLDL